MNLASASDAADCEVLLTRSQAARRIGVSVATVRRMEGVELQPIVIDGKHCFAPDEVERHRKVTDGELAARAFEMFNDDKTQVDVVIALKESPESIRKLFQDWVEMSDCVVVGPPGIGGWKWKRMKRLQLTRHLLFTCVHLALSDPRMRTRVERELGQKLG